MGSDGEDLLRHRSLSTYLFEKIFAIAQDDKLF
jgi:hypothetical protein